MPDPSSSLPPTHVWSPDPADYSSREYLDHQEALAELRKANADAARQLRAEQVKAMLREHARRQAARDAGEAYVEPLEPI